MTLSATSIKNFAHQLGFSSCGITSAEPSPRLSAYLAWVKAGMQGTMHYMGRDDRVARRKDLNVILKGAKSLVIVTQDYYTKPVPPHIKNDPIRARISNYAWQVDYHDVMLPQLEQLAVYIQSQTVGEVTHRAYVDTGAILERSHAELAGAGFTGKNTMLIHPRRGSFFFIGEIITDLELEPNTPPEMPGCGSCTRCLSACPTDAFPQPYVLDARRCISYLTIEHKGFIDHALRAKMGRWVYGCDVCQEVCPWERFAEPSAMGALYEADSWERAAPPIHSLLSLNQADFDNLFDRSPIHRIGRERLVRNACIAAGNSRQAELGEPLARLLQVESPLIRAHAAWGLVQLGQRNLVQGFVNKEFDSIVVSDVEQSLKEQGGPDDGR